MPAFPDELSRMVWPGRSRPSSRALSTMRKTGRSFREPPGLRHSILANTSTSGSSSRNRCTGTIGVWSPARQLRRGRLGHRGALEELGILRAPEVHGVGEDKIPEVVLGDGPVFDQLVRLRQRVAHVDHVEVADVRAVERVQLGAEWVVLAERPRGGPVVRLATEEERLGVEVDPVLLLRDLAGGEVVEIFDADRKSAV